MANYVRPQSDMLKIRTWEMPTERYFHLGLIPILKPIELENRQLTLNVKELSVK